MNKRGDDWWIVWGIFLGSPLIVMAIVVLYFPLLMISDRMPFPLNVIALLSPVYILAFGLMIYRSHKK